jgi:hypothetical protein
MWAGAMWMQKRLAKVLDSIGVERLFQILDLVLAVDQYLHITFHAVDMNTVWMAATTQPKFPVSVIMRVMLQLDVNPDSLT